MSRLVERQHGYIARWQLLAIGYTIGWIRVRVRKGDLIPVHAGVYAVGHVPRGAIPTAHAAVLACGEGAVLSHDSAAAAYGLREWPRAPEVTVTGQRRRPGITVHRTITLTSRDVRTFNGIRTTSPARTIADIQDRLTDRQLVRAVNDARRAKLLGPAAVHDLLTRSARTTRLVDPAQNPTRSQLEDDFLAWLAHHGLPTPRINVMLHGFEVDALFPEERVVVELDGYAFHDDRAAFERDRERDAILAAHGYVVVRITITRLTDAEADRLRATLRRRRSSRG
jgi:very-short-patch-repair endonuclease